MSLLIDVTDKQREAIAHIEGPLLVVAGAGRGETRVVTHHIGHFIYHILSLLFLRIGEHILWKVETQSPLCDENCFTRSTISSDALLVKVMARML